jgi:protein required for attachment to host cells
MQLNSLTLEQASIVWVLVADPWQAQIYRYHHNKRTMPMHDSKRRPYEEDIKHHDLTPVSGMAFHAEAPDDFQVERDERGSPIATQDSGSNGEPYSNLCDELTQKLVKKVADKLKHALAAKAFDQLIIAAQPEIAEAYQQQLDPSVVDRVIAEIDKDFEHDKKRALLAHLQNTFVEARVA